MRLRIDRVALESVIRGTVSVKCLRLTRRDRLFWLMILLSASALRLLHAETLAAEEPAVTDRLIGYTELRTNLSGGRHANVRTERAVVIRPDGSGRRRVAEELIDDPDAWSQFAGWSPDGRTAIVNRGWQDPDNALWEEQHKRFRMLPGKWQFDSYLLDLETGTLTGVTAVQRVSHYNSVSYLPDGRKLLMTSLIDGVSKPFVMDLDGRNKRDISGGTNGFNYGLSASPDGKFVSYHEDYQVFVANADGSNKRRINTGNRFNFAPRWSPDGQWLLFLSGERGRSNPYVVRRDGTGLRQLADLGEYRGWILFLDVPDFHEGSSDVPVWAADGASVFYAARLGDRVELFQTTLDGAVTRLTKTAPGVLHYHPSPSADGKWLVYGSLREGVRQLFVMNLSKRTEERVTRLQPGRAAMWPHWQPVPAADQ